MCLVTCLVGSVGWLADTFGLRFVRSLLCSFVHLSVVSEFVGG